MERRSRERPAPRGRRGLGALRACSLCVSTLEFTFTFIDSMLQAGVRVFLAHSGRRATVVSVSEQAAVRVDSGETITVAKSELLTLEEHIRRIQRNQTLDSQQKSKAIQEAYRPQPSGTEETISAAAASPGVPPTQVASSASVPPCSHYRTECVIVAACCGALFQCRLCHDDHTPNHKIDR